MLGAAGAFGSVRAGAAAVCAPLSPLPHQALLHRCLARSVASQSDTSPQRPDQQSPRGRHSDPRHGRIQQRARRHRSARDCQHFQDATETSRDGGTAREAQSGDGELPANGR